MHSLENYTRIQTKNRQSLYPFSDQNGAKIILCKANLREYPPPEINIGRIANLLHFWRLAIVLCT